MINVQMYINYLDIIMKMCFLKGLLMDIILRIV